MYELKIFTFGTFTISYGNNCISEKDNRTRKIWRLIKYIIANRSRKIAQDELIELLGNRENIDSTSSLKTMLHRARNTLDQLDFPESRNLILQKNGSYYWNNGIAQTLDEDDFKALVEKAESSISPDERQNLRLKALSIYKGYYLDRAFDDIPNIAELIQRYHKMAIKLFENAAAYLSERGLHNKVAELSRNAINTDPYQEVFHYYLIKACIDNSDHKNALLYYRRVNELFLGKFRINPSDRIRILYRYIVKEKHFTETSIEVVRDELLNKASRDKPIYCEFDSFRLICQVMFSDPTMLSEDDHLLTLFTVEPYDENSLPSEKQMRSAVVNLSKILESCLSGADVYTRYSVTQFIALLHSKKQTQTSDYISDICKAFEEATTEFPLKLTVSFTSLQEKV